MANKIKFALVGAGDMGINNANRICADARAEIVAICDTNISRARQTASRFGVAAVFPNIEELLASKVNFTAAAISTTNITHAPLSVALLKAGKNVYCEKPPAADLAGTKAIAAAAKKAKGVFMFGFNQRFDPWAQHAKQEIQKGQLGQIYHAQTQWHRRIWNATFGRWFTDKRISGGGPLLDIGVHRLDQTLWLMGFPKVLSACGASYAHLAKAESQRLKKSYSVEDFAVAFLRLAGGATLILQTSYLSYLPLGDAEMSTLIMGTRRGMLESKGVLRLMSNQAARPQDTLLCEYKQPRVSPMGSFLDSILKGRPSPCSAAEGLQVMEVLDAIYRSAASGKEVLL